MVNKPLKPLCLGESPRLEDILEDRIDISRYLIGTFSCFQQAHNNSCCFSSFKTLRKQPPSLFKSELRLKESTGLFYSVP